MTWIPVTERMPDPDPDRVGKHEVLIWKQWGHWDVASWCRDHWRTGHDVYVGAGMVTHWCEVEGPEGEK